MQQLVEEFIKLLNEKGDESRIEFMKRTSPSAMKMMGVTVPNARNILNQFRKKVKDFSPEDKIKLAHLMIRENIMELQLMAYEFIEKEKEIWSIIIKEDIQALNQNLDNWGSVDTYSSFISGHAWRDGIVDDQFILSFLSSEDVWQRRVAVVSTIPLNRNPENKKGDPYRTLMICEKVIDDHHDMINKALSWALRVLSKSNKEIVIDFIKRYKDRLHKRVIREVRHKLDHGTKN